MIICVINKHKEFYVTCSQLAEDLFPNSNLFSFDFSVIGELCNLLQLPTFKNFLTCLSEMNKRKAELSHLHQCIRKNGVTFSNVWPKKILFLLLHNSLDCIVQL